MTADRDKAGPTVPGLFVTWVLASNVVTGGHIVVQRSVDIDQEFDVNCGLDVDESEYHATALHRVGERLSEKPCRRTKPGYGSSL